MKCTRFERLLLEKPFYLCVVFVFRHLNYFGLRTTNVKGRTDHSVSLRWNKPWVSHTFSVTRQNKNDRNVWKIEVF